MHCTLGTNFSRTVILEGRYPRSSTTTEVTNDQSKLSDQNCECNKIVAEVILANKRRQMEETGYLLPDMMYPSLYLESRQKRVSLPPETLVKISFREPPWVHD